ncbi:hypothetical protein CICLE_v10017326mg [Citrus x clementina]|uniref:Uncharacterized protein n=1 Tax=Citrus clementina TaxID=85681 RepID=V4UFN1_CITCL|nr:hypothetical protein CICLE_v10017326mg [Citrus x clementina]
MNSNRSSLILGGGKIRISKKNKDVIDGKCSPIEPKSPAMIRAEKVQSNLELQFPSFAKSMIRAEKVLPLCQSCWLLVDSLVDIKELEF